MNHSGWNYSDFGQPLETCRGILQNDSTISGCFSWRQEVILVLAGQGVKSDSFRNWPKREISRIARMMILRHPLTMWVVEKDVYPIYPALFPLALPHLRNGAARTSGILAAWTTEDSFLVKRGIRVFHLRSLGVVDEFDENTDGSEIQRTPTVQLMVYLTIYTVKSCSPSGEWVLSWNVWWEQVSHLMVVFIVCVHTVRIDLCLSHQTIQYRTYTVVCINTYPVISVHVWKSHPGKR